MLALALVTAALPVRAPQSDVERIEAYLERLEAFGWSGVCLVERKGKVALNRGFGLADPLAGRACDEGTVFEVASATKPFTAAVVLSLAEEGSLDLDRSIADLLPGVPEERAGITCRHLLSHTSGMPRTAADGRGADLAEAVRAYLDPAPTAAPGAGFEYWNGGYALLAGVIETVTGKAYVDVCRERLFVPLGLERTGFTGDEGPWEPEDQAVGYRGDVVLRAAAEHPYGEFGYQYRGMGGLVTSAEELWTLAHHVVDGDLLGRKRTAEMLREVQDGYGLGWRVGKTRGGAESVSHGGDVAGFHADLRLYPGERAGLVLLTNMDHTRMGLLAGVLEGMLLEGGPAPPIPAPVLELKARDLEKLAGRYVTDQGDAVEVEARGLGLVLRPSNLLLADVLAGVEHDGDRRALAQRHQGIVEAVARGDAEAIAGMLAPGIPATWPGHLTGTIWKGHVDAWGPLEAVRPVALVAVPGGAEGASECVLALDHGRRTSFARVRLVFGRLSTFELDVRGAAPLRHFAPRVPERGDRAAEPVFVTHRWDALGWRDEVPTLAFEPSTRKPRTLLVRTPGGDWRLARER